MNPSRRSAAAFAAGIAVFLFAAPEAFARKPAQPQASPRQQQQAIERAAFTADEAAAARIAGIPEARFFADDVAAYDAALASAQASGEPWLVLSGGGENGAFSAGILKGWTAAGTRPAFSVVTGVSTGALIAPFAFAGAAYDGFLEEAYTAITAADIFEFGAKADSLVDSWPLKRLIERHVTPRLLADIAAEHRKGRRLLVVTTNVDAQRPVAWNLGAIAAEGSPSAQKLFRDVLLASASIPGVFPPVRIDAEANGRKLEELHADGGITTPFFLAPEAAVLGRARAERAGAQKVYVLVNNSLRPEFEVTDRMLVAVLGRSLSAAVKAGTRAAIAAHGAYGRRHGVDLQFAAIDARFTAVAKGPFDQAYMKALFGHAERLARDGAAFGADPLGAPEAAVARK
ncbi:MAG TPA: patatin-like phospholipase family protein [Beijerinckiaceae bacterium]|jgi:predicted patatin/cPLA2 family phospholipase